MGKLTPTLAWNLANTNPVRLFLHRDFASLADQSPDLVGTAKSNFCREARTTILARLQLVYGRRAGLMLATRWVLPGSYLCPVAEGALSFLGRRKEGKMWTPVGHHCCNTWSLTDKYGWYENGSRVFRVEQADYYSPEDILCGFSDVGEPSFWVRLGQSFGMSWPWDDLGGLRLTRDPGRGKTGS